MTGRTSATEGPPDPGRHRRWAWWVGIVLVLAGGLVAMHHLVGRQEEEKLRSVVAGIKARGEPLYWREFAPQPVAPEQNAAAFYREALKQYYAALAAGPGGGRPPDANASHSEHPIDLLHEDVLTDGGLRARHARDLREILTRCGGVFTPCRRARDCAENDWGLDFGGLAFTCRLPDLGGLRRASCLLCLGALAAQEDGNSLEAVERLRDVMALARSVESMPTLVTFAMATHMRQGAWQVVEQISPRLLTHDDGAAARQAARALIDDLLAPDGFPRAVLAQRAIMYDAAERVRAGGIPLRDLLGGSPPPGLKGLLRSLRVGNAEDLYIADETELLERLARHVQAARAETYPAALATLRTGPWAGDPSPGSLVAILLWAPEGRTYVFRFRELAFRRMAATALAVRLYQLDHGRRPATLAELVPKYLPTMPADPFSPHGRAILYLPGRATLLLPSASKPLLYSVFKDGKDDGGKFIVDKTGAVNLINPPDLVFFLDGDRPVPPVREGDANEPARTE